MKPVDEKKNEKHQIRPCISGLKAKGRLTLNPMRLSSLLEVALHALVSRLTYVTWPGFLREG